MRSGHHVIQLQQRRAQLQRFTLEYIQPGSDLGRPVATFYVMLAPGETKNVSATFTGAEGTYAAPKVWTTPMLNPTAVTLQAEGCTAQ